MFQFESPLEIHGSQTPMILTPDFLLFESPLEIHGSQTSPPAPCTSAGLSPLWKYTALKLGESKKRLEYSLSPLWKYTALKQEES